MFTKISSSLFEINRWQKRLIMLTCDFILLAFAVWAAFAIRLGSWSPPLNDGIWLLILAPTLTIPIFVKVGLYRAVVRYIGGQAMIAVLKGVTLSTVLLTSIAYAADLQGVPRSVFIIYWFVAFLLIGSSRYWIRLQFQHLHNKQYERTPVLIYGAGHSGTQLANALSASAEFQPMGFVDDDLHLQKLSIQALKVYSPKQLPELVVKFGIKKILLAIPSASIARRREIIQSLESLPVQVLTLPSMADLVDGKISITALREISIDDLLGREAVNPDAALLRANITYKVVMVTGAGGSIGSEICRQIVMLEPQALLLFEQSEFALYNIHQELSASFDKVLPLLGSVTDSIRLIEIMQHFNVQTIYHAAAYKHVPMVEHNVLEGIRNNILGTWRTALAAQQAKVETFVLISTDKAVRPTNTMGATKRCAELLLQALHRTYSDAPTRFTMVRFGNVLGSSGSVVPLFQEQIRKGGPITLTHQDIIRYFMTIPEAAQLVIQAGAMGQGGDVFVLDMGEPVRIYDLAKRMIKLSGLQLKDHPHVEGDIEIQITGLRPGEKLYEELLIGDNVLPTQHTRILRAQETELPLVTLMAYIQQFEALIAQQNAEQARQLLQSIVQEFKPQCEVVDLLYAKLPKVA
ncbi:MAG: nucleoside-diphosphate sugar epimerase/dehydratase [Candidatus Thiocaldithrix dubininis]|uniref:Nucleoside-diphosphate sugar epimerase/dehydratase n=1 Tax=Candidatus Thiocaldithrix dubininis TaxID=3080823 RepID=A0AA95H6B9_9GAMM|nr:MAG: nucleoside-diphosphate sugar epimerase/dehydratase [Candidatus Thiocaldithrix dubininis]